LSEGSQPSNASRFGVFAFTPLRILALARSRRCGSNWRTRGVGRSIRPLQPVSEVPGSIRRYSRHLRSSRADATGVTDQHVHGRSSHIEHHRFDRAVHSRIMHQRVLQRGVPLRESDIHGLAGRSLRDRLLPCISRPAALLGFSAPLAGLLPQTGVAPLPAFRAHVSFRSPRVRPD